MSWSEESGKGDLRIALLLYPSGISYRTTPSSGELAVA